jgi:hypothetical protein
LYYARSLSDAAPVAHRVKRPVNLLVKRRVEDLVHDEQAEEDPGDYGHNASWPGRQHQRHSHQKQQFYWDADEGVEGELPGTVRRHQGEPQDRERKRGDSKPHCPADARARAGTVKPDHVAAERLGQQ